MSTPNQDCHPLRMQGGGAGAPESSTERDPAERILAAAESCFRASGFAETSMRAIGEKANVSKSLVHYHFGSKERLYADVQVRIYNRLASQITRSVEEHGGSLSERGLLALDALIDAIRDSGDLAAYAVLGAQALSNETLARHIERMRIDLRALLVSTTAEILGPDAAGLPMSIETFADLLWATLTGLGLQTHVGDAPERVDRGLEGMRDLVALALRNAEGAGLAADRRSDDTGRRSEEESSNR